jgi:2-oxoacid:acceptor oxidoreductase gamma subunit (pyruvate/2-ketoisovalerate family)
VKVSFKYLFVVNVAIVLEGVKLQEIRFHGRGGQGAVTAAELLAVAAVEDGKYAKSFPFFGVERRGAPVQAFCRISEKPIRINQNVYDPDIIVVLDPSLIKVVNVCSGLKKEGIVIANSKETNEQLQLACKEVYTVNATDIAIEEIGRPIVNTAMLGAFDKVTGLVKLGSLEKAIRQRFEGEIAEKNVRAIERCCKETRK